MPFINCEIELDFSWSNKCVVSEISRTFRAVRNPPVQEVAIQTTGATVPVVTLSKNDNIKFLENIKQGF